MTKKIRHIDFAPVIERIRKAQNKVFQQINAELVKLY